eukprot:3137534-Pyramimonas_sp.AAC.1
MYTLTHTPWFVLRPTFGVFARPHNPLRKTIEEAGVRGTPLLYTPRCSGLDAHFCTLGFGPRSGLERFCLDRPMDHEDGRRCCGVPWLSAGVPWLSAGVPWLNAGVPWINAGNQAVPSEEVAHSVDAKGYNVDAKGYLHWYTEAAPEAVQEYSLRRKEKVYASERSVVLVCVCIQHSDKCDIRFPVAWWPSRLENDTTQHTVEVHLAQSEQEHGMSKHHYTSGKLVWCMRSTQPAHRATNINPLRCIVASCRSYISHLQLSRSVALPRYFTLELTTGNLAGVVRENTVRGNPFKKFNRKLVGARPERHVEQHALTHHSSD